MAPTRIERELFDNVRSGVDGAIRKGSKRPEALQLFVTFATTVGGTTVPALADEVATAPATPLPFEAKLVSEDSTETANQPILPQSSTTGSPADAPS